MESSTLTCSFSDALYITAEEGSRQMMTSPEPTSSYYSAFTHIDDTFQQSSDSGLSSSSPGYFVESEVDINLLEETLGDIDGEDNVRITPDEGKLISATENNSAEDNKSIPDSFIVVPPSKMNSKQEFTSQNNENDTQTNSNQESTSQNNENYTTPRKARTTSKASDTASNFTFDGEYIDSEMFDQPSMEYEESWQPCAESSPMKKEARDKIIIRELSFDECQDVKGMDLMAPVFLAVTNEDDDNVFDMRRKAKSIEDLCSTISYPKSKDINPRQRSHSANSTKPMNKIKKPSPLSIDTRKVDAVNSLEDAKERLSSLSASLKSHLSFEDLHSLTSTNSYHTSVEFEIPNSRDFLPSPMESVFSETDNEIEGANEENVKELKIDLSKIAQERTPHRVNSENCGFWEYPYGSPSNPSSPEPNQTPELVKSPSRNTSPTSPGGNTNPSDRFVVVSVVGQQRIVDMKLIEPYLMILTHGGHHIVDKVCHVIVVFNAYYLPHRSIPKYNIVLEQLFYYCAHALDLLVTDSYEIVFINSAMNGNNMPPRHMIKQCYDMIQYRLRKSLNNIYFVYPSLLLKTVLRFTRFFISTKFRRKMRFVKNLKTLKNYLPLEYIFISPEMRQMEKKFS